MGLLDRFKKDKSEKKKPQAKEVKSEPTMAELYGKSKDRPVKEKSKGEKQEKVQATDKPKEAKRSEKGDSGIAHKILIKPVISEKATYLGQFNQYVFEIHPRANKIQVKEAVRSLYHVEPVHVKIINNQGKHVTFGRVDGKTKSKKKAIVQLKQGDSIKVYEGV